MADITLNLAVEGLRFRRAAMRWEESEQTGKILS